MSDDKRGTPPGQGVVKNAGRGGGGQIGNPPHVHQPTIAENVGLLRLAGVTLDRIARIVGLSEDTLQRHYRDELDLTKAKVDAKIAGTLVNRALAGDTACLIWYTKSQMGWSDKTRLELTGADGGAIVTEQKSAADTVKARLEAIRERQNAANDKAA